MCVNSKTKWVDIRFKFLLRVGTLLEFGCQLVELDSRVSHLPTQLWRFPSYSGAMTSIPMAMLSAIRDSKKQLRSTVTEVTTAGGQRLRETHGDDGETMVEVVGRNGLGYVADLKPDLQVAVILDNVLLGTCYVVLRTREMGRYYHFFDTLRVTTPELCLMLVACSMYCVEIMTAYTVFDLISEHAPFFFFHFNINNYLKWLSWGQYKFTIYMPDGHTCPDVEGPLIRSN